VPRPIVIAHRGASGYRPEHTRAAYELGIAQGADAIEPDIVATRDGVLVVRHENEISGTTDVASRAEFASRRTTKSIDGVERTGWFSEDFDWHELATLRARERLPQLRKASAAYDGEHPILKLSEVAALAEASGVALVAEIKHATYFASIGLPLDELFAAEMSGWGGRLILESFEQSVLHRIRDLGVVAPLVFLVESDGAPFDLVARDAGEARSYAEHVSEEGLARLGTEVDGVSLDKSMLLAEPALTARAHEHGLSMYTWTLRPENRFLSPTHRHGEAGEFGDYRAEWQELLRTGLDGVFADYPDLAIDVVGAA
jgi:glycerophosphoryl diester phosphodiesterase